MAARNDTYVKPFFELLRKNITKKSSYHLIPDGRRIRQLNLLTLPGKPGLFVSRFLENMIKILSELLDIVPVLWYTLTK